MKRIIASAFAIAIASLAIAPAFAEDVDLKTDAGIKKFWELRHVEGASGGPN